LTARATYWLTEGVFVPNGTTLTSAIAILSPPYTSDFYVNQTKALPSPLIGEPLCLVLFYQQ
jgi:hypothetical protein